MSGYYNSISIFNPKGNLTQVEYAKEAVKRGMCTIAIRGKDCVVLAVEKKSVSKLQEARTIKKILQLDKNICLTFSGLNADGRILANVARLQCQQYRYSYEDEPTVDYISKYIAQTMQKYTQSGGVRPFGISTLVAGFDNEKKPRLFQNDPSGVCTEWKASVLGRNEKQVKEFLEKNFSLNLSVEECLQLAARALRDVVESGKNNVELVVVKYEGVKALTEEEIEQIQKSIETQ